MTDKTLRQTVFEIINDAGREFLQGDGEPFDFEAHLALQREWSESTFGPDPRVNGIVSHIRKELDEILADPTDLYEWVDVAILALDGAWRAGHSPKEIIAALVAKQQKNMLREWPDWRTAPPDTVIEHVRDEREPVRTAAGELEQFTIRSERGNLFRCDCGCNVFHKPDNTRLRHYKCNGCEAEYDGE